MRANFSTPHNAKNNRDDAASKIVSVVSISIIIKGKGRVHILKMLLNALGPKWSYLGRYAWQRDTRHVL